MAHWFLVGGVVGAVFTVAASLASGVPDGEPLTYARRSLEGAIGAPGYEAERRGLSSRHLVPSPRDCTKKNLALKQGSKLAPKTEMSELLTQAASRTVSVDTRLTRSILQSTKPGPLRQSRKSVKVGGAAGFGFYVLTSWKPPTIRVGDRLSFTIPNVAKPLTVGHNVYLLPNKAAFDNCDFSGAKFLGNLNYTTPPFKRPGRYYYACGCCAGDYFHCAAQQKVSVKVVR